MSPLHFSGRVYECHMSKVGTDYQKGGGKSPEERAADKMELRNQVTEQLRQLQAKGEDVSWKITGEDVFYVRAGNPAQPNRAEDKPIQQKVADILIRAKIGYLDKLLIHPVKPESGHKLFADELAEAPDFVPDQLTGELGSCGDTIPDDWTL